MTACCKQYWKCKDFPYKVIKNILRPLGIKMKKAVKTKWLVEPVDLFKDGVYIGYTTCSSYYDENPRWNICIYVFSLTEEHIKYLRLLGFKDELCTDYFLYTKILIKNNEYMIEQL